MRATAALPPPCLPARDFPAAVYLPACARRATCRLPARHRAPRRSFSLLGCRATAAFGLPRRAPRCRLRIPAAVRFTFTILTPAARRRTPRAAAAPLPRARVYGCALRFCAVLRLTFLAARLRTATVRAAAAATVCRHLCLPATCRAFARLCIPLLRARAGAQRIFARTRTHTHAVPYHTTPAHLHGSEVQFPLPDLPHHTHLYTHTHTHHLPYTHVAVPHTHCTPAAHACSSFPLYTLHCT